MGVGVVLRSRSLKRIPLWIEVEDCLVFDQVVCGEDVSSSDVLQRFKSCQDGLSNLSLDAIIAFFGEGRNNLFTKEMDSHEHDGLL